MWLGNAVTSSTLHADPQSNDTIDVFYINNTASETFLHELGDVRIAEWMFMTGVELGGQGRIRDVGRSVLQSPQ